jgi:hypothetical protein
MEAAYPKFTADQRATALSLCATFGLLPSGGSDFHGANKPDMELGDGDVPDTWLDALLDRAALR